MGSDKTGYNSRPVILGWDFVSPLGTREDRQWSRALAGESGIGELTRFPLRKGFPVRHCGQVEDFDPAPYPFLTPRKMAGWTSPIFRYSMLVAYRALKNSSVEITSGLAPRVAVTFSSAVGGLDAVIHADRLMVSENKNPHPFTNPNSCINMVGGKISMLTGATGPICSTVTACATGCTSMIMGAMLLKQNKADVAICGAADFCIVEPIVAGFATMNAAYRPKENQIPEPPEKLSRPFSANRRGFIISEGAGCIIIATPEFAAANGLKPRVEMAGWAMSSDAHHFVTPNLETITRCMRESITDAGIGTGDIDAVNAHAASTRVGDKVESDALREVFGRDIPPASANKSLIGHAMGASSALETIFAVKGMLEDVLLPTINYLPDPEIELDCVPEGARKMEQEFVLKNSFGFGGCNSCLILRRLN